MKKKIGAATTALTALLWGCYNPPAIDKSGMTLEGTGFTSGDVNAIVEELSRLDENTYRVQLPVETAHGLRRETIGSLPMRRVELIAAQQEVELQPEANIIAVFGCAGDGPGSHHKAGNQAANQAHAVGARLQEILSSIDEDYYQLLR